jgi:hypothetical protein
VAAASFVFSGVVVSEVFYGAFQPGAALLPWAVWGVARNARGRFARAFPIFAVFALLLLAGDVFSLALALLATAIWLVAEVPAGQRRPRAVGLAFGLLAAGLFALPQILATVLLAPETRRIIGGLTLGEALGFTISPWRLVELVIPYPFGPAWSMDLSRDWGAHVFRHFFVSFFAGPIALVGLLGLRSPSVGGSRFARVLFLVSVALALSGHLVPASWGGLPSPIPLRYPEKFMLGATVALAVAAGVAVDRLGRRATGRTGILAMAGGLAVAAVVASRAPQAVSARVVAAVGGAPALDAAASEDLPAALAIAGLLWAATFVAAALLPGHSRARLALALVLLTAVAVFAGRPIAQAAHEGTVFPPTAFARTLQKRDPKGAYRTLDESLYRPGSSMLESAQIGDYGGSEFFRQSWNYYTPTLWDRGTVFNSDLDAGDLSRIESLRRVAAVAASQSDSGAFFASLSLRYGVRFRDQNVVAGFRPFGADASRFWDENPDAQPDLRLAARWREVSGPVAALAALPGLAADEIVVESGRAAQGSARPGRLRILEKSPERLLLEVVTPDPTWLFVLRGDWRYRTVRLNSIPAELSPAQIAFSALAVPAGEHRIEWREGIPGLEVSRWGPVASALLLLFLSRVRKAA